MTTLEEIADELYGLPPEEFTAARDARARALRVSDRALADAVRALRRPTTAAWLVDLLVRERRDDVEALLSLGDALRQAQRTLSGDTLRGVGRQRRTVVAALVRAAAALGRAHGRRVGAEVELEVESTLEAALADPAAAAALRGGRLVKPLAYAGLGPVRRLGPAPDGRSALLPTPAAAQRRDDDTQARRREIAQAERAALEACGAADDAQREVERRVGQAEAAVQAARQARGRSELARARVERARRALEQARRGLAEEQCAAQRAERSARTAQAAAAEAERAARAAHAAAERARTRLDHLRRS